MKDQVRSGIFVESFDGGLLRQVVVALARYEYICAASVFKVCDQVFAEETSTAGYHDSFAGKLHR
jgi:hypothetical protein